MCFIFTHIVPILRSNSNTRLTTRTSLWVHRDNKLTDATGSRRTFRSSSLRSRLWWLNTPGTLNFLARSLSLPPDPVFREDWLATLYLIFSFPGLHSPGPYSHSTALWLCFPDFVISIRYPFCKSPYKVLKRPQHPLNHEIIVNITSNGTDWLYEPPHGVYWEGHHVESSYHEHLI